MIYHITGQSCVQVTVTNKKIMTSLVQISADTDIHYIISPFTLTSLKSSVLPLLPHLLTYVRTC